MSTSSQTTKKELVTEFRTRQILAAAREVIDGGGIEAATMEEIAAAAGVAKGTVYLYFRSKDELIEALITQVGEHMLREIEALIKGPGAPRDKLEKLVSLLLAYLGKERTLFPVYARDLLRGGRGAREGFWRRLQDMENHFVDLVTSLFAEGIATGQFIAANPRLLTFLIRGLVRAVGFYQMVEGQEQAAKEALPVLLTLLSAGLTRPNASSTEVAAI
jgi:TetR/AcrR family transcriptional regulator, transcriptional repressor for nem operon